MALCVAHDAAVLVSVLAIVAALALPIAPLVRSTIRSAIAATPSASASPAKIAPRMMLAVVALMLVILSLLDLNYCVQMAVI